MQLSTNTAALAQCILSRIEAAKLRQLQGTMSQKQSGNLGLGFSLPSKAQSFRLCSVPLPTFSFLWPHRGSHATLPASCGGSSAQRWAPPAGAKRGWLPAHALSHGCCRLGGTLPHRQASRMAAWRLAGNLPPHQAQACQASSHPPPAARQVSWGGQSKIYYNQLAGMPSS